MMGSSGPGHRPDGGIPCRDAIGRGARVRNCIIDKHVRIPEGMVIGVDPKADRQRFHVSPKGITLVTAEMLGQGAAAAS